MLIKSTSISIKYNKIDNIKKAYILNEEMLKKQFNEATILPIPDDAPLEIPRVIVKSLGEHSQLNISPVAATLQINYDAGFERDWEKCEEYIKNKMDIIFAFLNQFTNNEYEYVGVVTENLMDEYKDNGAKILASNLLRENSVDEIYDLNVRYTFVEDDSIFINIMLQNARLFKDGTTAEVSGGLALENQVGESIGAVIDINDRYGFNSCNDYKSNSEMLNTIISKMTVVINNRLKGLLEKGEY